MTPEEDDEKKEKVKVGVFNFDEESFIIGSAIGANPIIIQKSDRASVRKWWHEIIGNYGKYSCYAMFLVLPSDKEAIKYLTKFGKELNIISGDNCLVIALSKNTFKSPSFDSGIWSEIVEEHTSEGYSVKISQIFNIELTEFPCLLLFQDIRSSKHITISLIDLPSDKISEKMRAVFSEIHKSVKVQKNPLEDLLKFQSKEKIKNSTQKLARKIESFTEKTFEAAMNAFIGATIK